MSRYFMLLVLTMVSLCSCEQKSKTTTSKVAIGTAQADTTKNEQRPPFPGNELDKYIYTDTVHTSFAGTGLRIQNSFPKGGSIAPDGTQYVDSIGKNYAFAVFWTRIINETNTPIELNIHFPADSLAIFSSPDAYLKLLLPEGSMTLNKLSLYNYGLTDLKPFIDANLHQAAQLQKTIKPNEAYLFYVGTLTYQAGGTPRAAMALKEQNLYYSVEIAPHGSTTIPCGKIVF